MEGPGRGEAALGSVEQGSIDVAKDLATGFSKYSSGNSATDSAGDMGRGEDTGVGGTGERVLVNPPLRKNRQNSKSQ
ncbi:hypothetical protein NPIL_628921 [Nephila pilipes]|uniref:Uncharacterized protein n=1 Tax=Nephila pilipes TaxID=299642 RepID=A0A8X6QI84_NEPPI|nr:hypothetical protein NPIL_628921 [Nephila pilipes]